MNFKVDNHKFHTKSNYISIILEIKFFKNLKTKIHFVSVLEHRVPPIMHLMSEFNRHKEARFHRGQGQVVHVEDNTVLIPMADLNQNNSYNVLYAADLLKNM